MDRQELMNECNMLSGNINRMMVTDDYEELMSMFTYAVKRINEVYWENKKRINMQNYKVTKNCIEPLIHEPRKEDKDA